MMHTLTRNDERVAEQKVLRASRARGFTLVELIVAVGLFALVMTIASGAYIIMIGASRHAQAIATGVDNLSFALDEMTREIRTGTQYSCGGGDCTGGSQFSFTDPSGATITYARGTQQGVSGTVYDITRNGLPITDSSVNVTSLSFTTFGISSGHTLQPRIIMVIAGQVSAGPAVPAEDFTVETSATMRGINL